MPEQPNLNQLKLPQSAKQPPQPDNLHNLSVLTPEDKQTPEYHKMRERIDAVKAEMKRVSEDQSLTKAQRMRIISGELMAKLAKAQRFERKGETKLLGALFEQIKTAQEILGVKDVLGPNDIASSFGLNIEANEIPNIPFSRQELARAHELDQFLVYRPKGVTMEYLKDYLKDKKTKDNKPFFYKQDWYNSDPIFMEKTTGNWALTAKEVIPDSTGKNYLDQTEEAVGYIKGKVFKDSPLPAEYQEAIEEFNQVKDGIRKIISSDWSTAAGKLAKLKITELTRQTPAEAYFDIFAYYLKNNERIMKNKYTWTKRLASGGKLVRVGFFVAVGAAASDWGPGDSVGSLGVVFSRSH